MTEHPINLKSWEVRAILDGRKTMTRRVLKRQPRGHAAWQDDDSGRWWVSGRGEVGDTLLTLRWAPGDRLWVRETWAKVGDNEDDIHCCPDLRRWSYYRADDSQPERLKWRSPAVMPRWASRITLLVTDVRVERVQDITRGDCMTEGCPFPNIAQETDPVGWFCELWTHLNGADAWERNDWVSVTKFERVP